MAKARRKRDRRGRFVKVRHVLANPGRRKGRKRRSRKARRNPARSWRRARRVRRNPSRGRRKRRLRRNHMGLAMAQARRAASPAAVQRVHIHASPSAVKRASSKKSGKKSGSGKRKMSPKQKAALKKAQRAAAAARKGKKKSVKKSGKKSVRKSGKKSRRRISRKVASKLWRQVRSLRAAVKRSPKRSVRRSEALAQYHRGVALRKVVAAGRKQHKSKVAAAMFLRTNPGGNVLGLVKTLAPQVGVGAGSLVGCAFIGAKIGNKLQEQPSLAGKKITPYLPAISTAGVAVGGYLLANKVAPNVKGAVIIGGMLGAIVQAIVTVAAQSAEPDSVVKKAASALGLGEYTMVGEYTRVGGRAYAEGGMFREIGEYTMVGSGADNATEWAADSLRGLDDATEWAPGEGGVLSGGMFRG